MDGGAPWFTGKHATIARGETWIAVLTARTSRCECAWRLHLKLRYRGEQHELVVPPVDRAPFRMTGFPATVADYAVQYVWNRHGVIVRNDCVADRKSCAGMYLPPTAPGPIRR